MPDTVLPPSSPELCIIADLVDAFLETMPRKKRRAFLQALERRRAMAYVAPIIRPCGEDAILKRNRMLGGNWVSRRVIAMWSARE